MTTYTTIIRAILRDNEIESDEKAVLAEMRRIMDNRIDHLSVPGFIEICLEAEKAVRNEPS